MKTLIPLLLVSLVSCGRHKSSGPSNVRSVDPLEAYHQRPLEVTQTEDVSLIRKKQIIVRYDCNGHVTSNKLETINFLSKKLTAKYENRKEAWSFDVYNRTTRDGNRGVFVTQGQFVIDYSPTVFHMKVNEGPNDIEYVYKRCTKISEDANHKKICSGELLTEKEGIVRVNVTYDVEIIPGEQTIRPTPEQCKPKT